jgi:hypothetical protein
LICFNCDGIGHFSNKCPYKKNKINEEDDPKKQIQKGRRNKNKFFKKIFAPRKTVPHQMKMKSTTVIQKGYYSWK